MTLKKKVTPLPPNSYFKKVYEYVLGHIESHPGLEVGQAWFKGLLIKYSTQCQGCAGCSKSVNFFSLFNVINVTWRHC